MKCGDHQEALLNIIKHNLKAEIRLRYRRVQLWKSLPSEKIYLDIFESFSRFSSNSDSKLCGLEVFKCGLEDLGLKIDHETTIDLFRIISSSEDLANFTLEDFLRFIMLKINKYESLLQLLYKEFNLRIKKRSYALKLLKRKQNYIFSKRKFRIKFVQKQEPPQLFTFGKFDSKIVQNLRSLFLTEFDNRRDLQYLSQSILRSEAFSMKKFGAVLDKKDFGYMSIKSLDAILKTTKFISSADSFSLLERRFQINKDEKLSTLDFCKLLLEVQFPMSGNLNENKFNFFFKDDYKTDGIVPYLNLGRRKTEPIYSQVKTRVNSLSNSKEHRFEQRSHSVSVQYQKTKNRKFFTLKPSNIFLKNIGLPKKQNRKSFKAGILTHCRKRMKNRSNVRIKFSAFIKYLAIAESIIKEYKEKLSKIFFIRNILSKIIEKYLQLYF